MAADRGRVHRAAAAAQARRPAAPPGSPREEPRLRDRGHRRSVLLLQDDGAEDKEQRHDRQGHNPDRQQDNRGCRPGTEIGRRVHA